MRDAMTEEFQGERIPGRQPDAIIAALARQVPDRPVGTDIVALNGSGRLEPPYWSATTVAAPLKAASPGPDKAVTKAMASRTANPRRAALAWQAAEPRAGRRLVSTLELIGPLSKTRYSPSY